MKKGKKKWLIAVLTAAGLLTAVADTGLLGPVAQLAVRPIVDQLVEAAALPQE